MKKILALLTLVYGCGSENPFTSKDIRSEDLRAIYEEFMDKCRAADKCGIQNDRSLIIEYGDTGSGNVLGWCYRERFKANRIVITPRIKNSPLLEVVMYHELGHCVLGLGHYENGNDIMNAFVINGSEFKKEKSYYINRMFGRTNDVLFLADQETTPFSEEEGNCVHDFH